MLAPIKNVSRTTRVSNPSSGHCRQRRDGTGTCIKLSLSTSLSIFLVVVGEQRGSPSNSCTGSKTDGHFARTYSTESASQSDLSMLARRGGSIIIALSALISTALLTPARRQCFAEGLRG